MLERVAMHQTRLRVPGLGLEAKGVALGARGLVLLASLERLVAFLSLYTSSQSLGELASQLRIEVVRSRLGTREIVVSFPAQSSGRMDRIAEVARVALGYCFTGTSRHFVQYRDAAAPFGYDAAELVATDADYALYHGLFSQVYEHERDIGLRALLLGLRPVVDPRAGREPGPSWVLADEGLGPAWIHYLVRSRVRADVGVIEQPPASAFEEAPVRRFLFRASELPERMVRLALATPGLGVFRPVAPGAAVEVGFRHPIALRACPAFRDDELVLFRGREQDPVAIETLPALGEVAAFARVTYAGERQGVVARAARDADGTQSGVTVPIRLAPSLEPWRAVRASHVAPADYGVLRRILYALGPRTLREASVAITDAGAFLLNPAGVESTPVGAFLGELRPGLFVAAGYSAVPPVDPDVLWRALGAPAGTNVFLLADGRAFGIATGAFRPLEDALVEGFAWAPLEALSIEPALATELPRVVLEDPGIAPLRGVAGTAGS
jgi:hypothetical protein